VVVPHGRGFRIVAGERRWRAAKAAGHSHIPAIARSLKELEQIEIALIENIQRVDLSPWEQALAVYKLQHQFNLELEKIAEKLGKAPSTISNLARLLQLPENAGEALRKGNISEGHARAILALKNQPAQQDELLRSIIDNGWSVRQAENFVSNLKVGQSADKVYKTIAAASTDTALSQEIGQNLGTKVKIKRSSRGGQIIIHFNNEQKLTELSSKLKELT
jgi:ParB family chromosome partitioning protein